MTDGESLNMVMLIANMTGGYKLDYGMIMMGVLFCPIPYYGCILYPSETVCRRYYRCR